VKLYSRALGEAEIKVEAGVPPGSITGAVRRAQDGTALSGALVPGLPE
jgi:hypothetical protein